MHTALQMTEHPPELTPDGHRVIINGRRWRATDPEIPDDAATVLRHELMSARRAVGAALKSNDRVAEATARDRVQEAKSPWGSGVRRGGSRPRPSGRIAGWTW